MRRFSLYFSRTVSHLTFTIYHFRFTIDHSRRSRQLAMQPGAREAPVAAHCCRRYLQNLGCFINTQATEETQLDHLALPRIELRERCQRLVERDQVCSLLVRYERRLVQRHGPKPTPALFIA